MVQWYYKADGEEHGPVSQGELQALAALGQISPDDLVRNDKKPKWYPAKAVKGLVVDDDVSDPAPVSESDSGAPTRQVLDLETANEHLSQRVFVPKKRAEKPKVATDETKDTAEQLLSNRKKNVAFGASRSEIEAANATPMDMADEFRYLFGIQLPKLKKLNPSQKICLTLTLGVWLLLTLFAPHSAPSEARASRIYNPKHKFWTQATGRDAKELDGRHTTWFFSKGPQFRIHMKEETKTWWENGPEFVADNPEDDKNSAATPSMNPLKTSQSSGTTRDGMNVNDLVNSDISNNADNPDLEPLTDGPSTGVKPPATQVVAYSRMTFNTFRWSMESLVVIVVGCFGCYYLRGSAPPSDSAAQS